MFDHTRNRDTLDEIESRIGEDGCPGIHAPVPGEISADPEWMHLLSVYCAFFTDKSIDVLT